MVRWADLTGVVKQMQFSQSGEEVGHVIARDLLRNPEFLTDGIRKVRHVVLVLQKFDDANSNRVETKDEPTVHIEQDAAIAGL